MTFNETTGMDWEALFRTNNLAYLLDSEISDHHIGEQDKKLPKEYKNALLDITDYAIRGKLDLMKEEKERFINLLSSRGELEIITDNSLKAKATKLITGKQQLKRSIPEELMAYFSMVDNIAQYMHSDVNLDDKLIASGSRYIGFNKEKFLHHILDKKIDILIKHAERIADLDYIEFHPAITRMHEGKVPSATPKMNGGKTFTCDDYTAQTAGIIQSYEDSIAKIVRDHSIVLTSTQIERFNKAKTLVYSKIAENDTLMPEVRQKYLVPIYRFMQE